MAALTAIAGFLGAQVKRLYTRYVNDKTKKDAVETCVKAVEQLCKDLHGAEKFAEAKRRAVALLESKGVTVDETELELLIESAVQGFNTGYVAIDNSTVQGAAIDNITPEAVEELSDGKEAGEDV
jgi:hypothetical protein